MAASSRTAPAILPPRLILVFVGAMVVLSAALPWHAMWVIDVAVIVMFGVPHGALDVEIGRTLLRPQWGAAWFPLFALPYLTLVAVVLLAWRLAPEATLAGFLLASVWHFGSEERGGDVMSVVAIGGLPIALPVLLHPAPTAKVLAAISATNYVQLPSWLVATSTLWLPLAAVWVWQEVRASRVHSVTAATLISCIFLVLSPLTAFALYFVAVHAPTHMASLVREGWRLPRAKTVAQAWMLAVPATLLTVLIGTLLWPLYYGTMPARLVCLTVQMLAALTLPHMLLDHWLTQRHPTPQPVGKRIAVPESSREPSCEGALGAAGYPARGRVAPAPQGRQPAQSA